MTRTAPKFKWYKHCEVVAEVLQKVADGKLKRVMFFWPPRHGKSEEVSRLFSAYFLSRYPQYWVGINSYAADLALTLSRAARENFLRSGGAVKQDAKAVKHWETPEGGGMWAAGVGGPITGKGFHLGIIDDPLKNYEEASSETIREKQKEWYGSTFYTREEPWSDTDPNAAIVLIQTRWHEDDLAGWLLAQEGEDEEDAERWHIVNLPAIAQEESERQAFPETCTVEPDWREPGEALCPERRPIEKLRKILARIGEFFFGALFQQKPVPKSGLFYKVGKVEIVDAIPAGMADECRAYDLAATSGGGAWTVGIKGKTDRKGNFLVTDMVELQGGPEEVEALIVQTAALDGPGCLIRLPQDPGQAGKSQVAALTKRLAGYRVKSETVSGDKELRASPVAAQLNAGNVKFLKGGWNQRLLDRLRVFPGAGKDHSDALADWFNELALGRRGITAT